MKNEPVNDFHLTAAAKQPTPDLRRQQKRLLWDAAFVVLTLVACFVAFVYWYKSKMASHLGTD